jgi:hypothetical protein
MIHAIFSGRPAHAAENAFKVIELKVTGHFRLATKGS